MQKRRTLKQTQHRVSAPMIPAPEVERRTWYPGVTAVAAITFACLVGIMWGAYNPHCGMPQETGFPYFSETTPALRGFLYAADPMRIHTNTFYHLSYLLGEAFGIRGSYVPYQVVSRFSGGLGLRRLLPDCPSLC
jgi:hypothetical protein